MAIKISGFMIRPQPKSGYFLTWRIYGTKKVFEGRRASSPASREFVTEFKLVRRGGKIGFPDLELEPTDRGDGWKFYQLVAVDEAGNEQWNKDEELTLPLHLPDELERPLNVPTWLLWNLERTGVIAPGQLND